MNGIRTAHEKKAQFKITTLSRAFSLPLPSFLPSSLVHATLALVYDQWNDTGRIYILIPVRETRPVARKAKPRRILFSARACNNGSPLLIYRPPWSVYRCRAYKLDGSSVFFPLPFDLSRSNFAPNARSRFHLNYLEARSGRDSIEYRREDREESKRTDVNFMNNWWESLEFPRNLGRRFIRRRLADSKWDLGSRLWSCSIDTFTLVARWAIHFLKWSFGLSSRLVIETEGRTRTSYSIRKDSLPRISRSRKLERSVDFYFTILLGCEDPGVLSLEYSISKFYSSLDRTKLRHFFLPVIQEYIRPVGYFFEPVSLRRFARKGTHRVESWSWKEEKEFRNYSLTISRTN